MGRIHDIWAKHLAKEFKGKYFHRGPDVKTREKVIEVAISDSDIYSSIKQLRRSRKPKKYLAVPEYKANLAKRLTKGTGIGVMNLNGKIIKKCRKRRTIKRGWF